MSIIITKTWLLLFLILAYNPNLASASTVSKPNINENSKPVTSITLAPHLTELVYSAGGGKNLLGISAYSNYPEEVQHKQIIGDAFHLNLEVIKALNPGVIFYWQDGTPVQTIEQLKSLGFNLENIIIENLSDIPKAIEQISQTLNTKPIENAHKSFTAELKRLKQQAHKPLTALIQFSDQPIYTVNGNHWMSEAIEICGLSNVFTDMKQMSAAVTLESVVLKKPAVLVRLEPLKADSQLAQWPSIPAVKNNHVAVLEADHFTRPTLRILTAIQSLCEQVNLFQTD